LKEQAEAKAASRQAAVDALVNTRMRKLAGLPHTVNKANKSKDDPDWTQDDEYEGEFGDREDYRDEVDRLDDDDAAS